MAGVVIFLFAAYYVLNRRYTVSSGRRFHLQMIMLALVFAGLLVIIMALPISDSSRGQLLSLLGILLSAAIALSSTTILGNAMAGFMLRIIQSFKPGDYIRVGEYFGRVSERGLFHIEIQNEDSDLMTLPNLYLVNNPVKVVRASGTFITAQVSLGYDIPRTKIESLLLKAAQKAELRDPFIYILKLGDFSATYRAAGFLEDIKQVISARSRLNEMILDIFNEANIEIASPTLMNTRTYPDTKQYVPKRSAVSGKVDKTISAKPPESIVFDKAEQAAKIENIRESYDKTGKELLELNNQLEQIKDESKRQHLQSQIIRLEAKRELLSEILKKQDKQKKE
ncbi:MAG: mechanosensitive ion channel [candidate division Zixibacteria bacterium]|nr:mechanosensitive ion channel [candidate division Zixibacteria bacterium]